MPRLLTTLFCVSLLALAGCAKSTPVTDSPLPEGEQQDLRCTLLGKWQHTHIDGDPVEYADITWAFRPDGSGEYRQVVHSIGQRGTNPFTWRLEGRNIFLDLSKGGKTTVYRADKWTDSSMTWLNYMRSEDFSVERVEESMAECP